MPHRRTRACRSIENVSITNDTNLADFHRHWITNLTIQ